MTVNRYGGRRRKLRGGLSLKGIWSGIKSAYDWGRSVKPASKVLDYVPAAGNVPYVGAALKGLRAIGFGRRRRRGGASLYGYGRKRKGKSRGADYMAYVRSFRGKGRQRPMPALGLGRKRRKGGLYVSGLGRRMKSRILAGGLTL